MPSSLWIERGAFARGGGYEERAAVLSIALGIGAGPACAADFESPPTLALIFNWTGFYLGGEVGGGFGTSRKDFLYPGTTTNDFTISGAIGGGTAGYNQQFGSFVAGLEGDISGSGVQGETNCGNPRFNCGTKNNWLATLRGRFGYAFDNYMPYVTGGVADGDINVWSGLKSTGGGGVNFTTTKTGWTAGVGLETGFFSNWTIKAEYLYVQLQNANEPSNVGRPTTTKFLENIVRVGVNYKFR
jgi:outer membrane immunogenic protein